MDLQSGNVFLLQQPLVGTFQQALGGLYASNTSAPGAAARPVQFLDPIQFYAGAVAGLAYQTLEPPPVTSPATTGWAPLLHHACMWWKTGPPPPTVPEADTAAGRLQPCAAEADIAACDRLCHLRRQRCYLEPSNWPCIVATHSFLDPPAP